MNEIKQATLGLEDVSFFHGGIVLSKDQKFTLEFNKSDSLVLPCSLEDVQVLNLVGWARTGVFKQFTCEFEKTQTSM
jgi:hypothetical protein